MRTALLCLLPFTGAFLNAQSVTWTRTGPPINDGYNAVRVGDIDSDGYEDLAVQMYLPPLYTAGVFDQAIWFFSGRDGTLLRQGQRVFGGAEGIAPFSYAGDWDNDGVGDYVMAFGVLSCQCSALEVRSGRTDRTLWRHARSWPEEWLALAIGNLDLDADGLLDIVTATPRVQHPNQVNGRGLVYGFDHFGNVLWTRRSALPTESVGHDIAKYGDFDNDGCDDFLLGVGGHNGLGAVEITSGRTGQMLHRIYGTPGNGYGAAASVTGDMDGDGILDILVNSSGPFNPGVLHLVSVTTGQVLRTWSHNSTYGDDFGYRMATDIDVDQDGVLDIITTTKGVPQSSVPSNEGVVYVFSGRDGSILMRYRDLTNTWGAAFDRVVSLPPPPGELFPRFAVFNSGYRNAGGVARARIYMFSGSPDGVRLIGDGSPGTLPVQPGIGVRTLGPNSFRVTTSDAPAGALVMLVIGFQAPTVPVFDLPALGFSGCTLYPAPVQVGFGIAGTSGLATGYALHDFQRQLVSPATLGALPMFAQWIVLGSGAAWPGGVSAGLELRWR